MRKTLIIMRHADAENKVGMADSDRPLSEKGRKEQQLIARSLIEKGYLAKQIFCSPLLRAKQTAKITSEVMDECPVDVEDALGPAFDSSRLVHQVNACPESVLTLVGHQPNLSRFIYDLVGKDCLNQGLVPSGSAVMTFDGEAGFGSATFVEYLYPRES